MKGRVDVLGSGDGEKVITSGSGNIVTANGVVGVLFSGFTIDGHGTNNNGIHCYSSQMEIHDNTISQCGKTGIYCEVSDRVLIENNNISQCGSHGVDCFSSSNVTFENNTVTQCGGRGVYFRSSSSITVKNNSEISNCGGDGIRCDSTSGTIDNNTKITACSNGIYCYTSSPTISNNWITDVSQHGIVCYAQYANSSPTIINNTIDHCGYDGINCYGQCCPIGNASPNIRDNTITACVGNGIKCYASSGYSNPVIRGNKIVQNGANGVLANDGLSTPNLGTVDDPGYNEIYWNTRYDVDNVGAVVMAEMNWWGECPPNPAYFHGDVDYDPWLCEPIIPEIQSITPNSGPIIGGTEVTLKGKIFEDGATVRVGDAEATDVTVVDSETITAKTPPSATAGPKDVVVINPSGTRANLWDGFIYQPPRPGDVSGDWNVTAYDAALILQYVVGLIDHFPVDELLHPTPTGGKSHDYTVHLPEVKVYAGERLQMPILLDDVSGMQAGYINLKYEPSELKAVAVTPSSLMRGYYWDYRISDDEIRIAFAGVGDSYGGGEIFSINFELSGKEDEINHVILKEAQINDSQMKEQVGSVVILPTKSMLYQNYPNPFNPETWIPFKLAKDADVAIHIYDVSGRLVRELKLGFKEAGSYMSRSKAVYWDGRNEMDERVASGVYIYRMTAGGKSFVRKMVILK